MLFENAYAGSVIWLPQASSIAARIDSVADLVFFVSALFFIATVATMCAFLWKYHRSKKGRTTAYILGSHKLEFIWTVVPLIFMVFIFAWGYIVYVDLRREPTSALEINVVGRQWLWNFEYTNGRKTMNEIVVPRGEAVKLIMTSEDVIHSFYVPNFRLKQDVVPGAYTYITFVATLVGEHPIYCAEYCGTGHSDMLGKVVVVEPSDYKIWNETGKLPASSLAGLGISSAQAATTTPNKGPMKSLAEKGKELTNSKGCVACHSDDGSRKIGPSFKGIFGKKEELEGGKSVIVDENYIRESIVEPQAKIVKGYPPSMPTFKGLVSDDEMNAIIAYIKSLK